jgi:hypothetical protein
MTIAEVFLLLMFVVWLSSVIQSEPGGGDPNVTIAMLREEIVDLRTENTALRTERNDVKSEVEALKIMVTQWQTRYETATRGAPKCVPDNVLVDLSVINGTVSGRLATRDQDVANWFRDHGLSPDADWDGSQVDRLFTAVREWYASRRTAAGDGTGRALECRFDYRFTYKSAEDFRKAKKTFEAYFYPAGDREVAH